MKSIQAITSERLDDLLAQAKAAPRRRTICCFHEGDWEHCHRMLNALTVGTYVRPHRHADPHQSEGFILLRGKLALLIFDEEGSLDAANSLILSPAEGIYGMDIPPLIWHTLVALEDSVIYEVKGHPSGGYVGERDKSFASWAPAEGDDAATAYLAQLEAVAAQLA
jgi:cupin fold WbuC family metalloprotein